jgi:hypothetical protein
MGGFIGKVQELMVSPKPDPAIIKYVGGGLLFILLVILLVYIFNGQVQQAKTPPIASPENVALIQAKRRDTINADKQLDGSNSWNGLINQMVPGERYLVNFCPLTASLGGYVGGNEISGVFYSDFYLQKALRAGIRSFVLPICTYMDDNKMPPNWPISGDPAIVARDTKGKIISLNAISVKQFCTDLIRFNGQNPSQASEPLMLHLIEDIGYLPDSVKDEARYAKVLSKLASELSAIPQSMRLTNLGGYGSAVNSQNEANILTQVPLSELQSKVIIFTNFKTTIGQKSAYASLKPTLDDFTNFTIRPVIAQNANLNVGSGSRSLRLADISGSSIAWTDQARTIYHTALDYNLTNPPVGHVDNAIKTGIQVIPIPFYTNNIKPTWDLWKGYSWRIKEPGARYLKPDPVVPATPSAKMNARVSPDLQPGQAVVG